MHVEEGRKLDHTVCEICLRESLKKYPGVIRQYNTPHPLEAHTLNNILFPHFRPAMFGFMR